MNKFLNLTGFNIQFVFRLLLTSFASMVISKLIKH